MSEFNSSRFYMKTNGVIVVSNKALAIPSSITFTQNKREKNYILLFLALPFMLLVFLFTYVPLFGWIYAFFDYKPGLPLWQCEFVGLDYFKLFLTDTVDMLRVIKNTLIFAVIGILVTPLPMFFAILLNEIKNKKAKKFFQTVTTLPNFLSWVIIYSICFMFFSSEGILNEILVSTGMVAQAPQSILGNQDAVYWFQTLLGLWKTLGWSSIIYLAAITGLDQELYDAAMVDGAGRVKCAMHITLPGLMPTYIVLLLLNIGNFLNQGFEQYFLFKNASTAQTIEVLDLYVYRLGLIGQDYSYSIAIGIMKSAISIGLLFTANAIAKKVRGTAII